MKLSDAIRLGAMLKPQGFNGFIVDGATCAMGAALDAATHQVKDDSDSYMVIRRLWPITEEFVELPGDGMRCQMWYAIEQLNDNHKWTREQIADWVATIEPVEQSETQESAPTVSAVGVLVDVRCLTPRD